MTLLLWHFERVLQRITSHFAEAAQLYSLEVSLKKTEVLHQPAPKRRVSPPTHMHWQIQTENSQSIHILRLHHHIRCQTR